ncbi:2-hydroxyacid dehydrogenase [Paenibacillus sp. GCM10023252]|uniref:2-hydroxyacid dehydrogenase n=1 Tax=Paenibacillus sp. GCM10023252 TaxID=3252649 RepID=UPI0036228B26
MNKKAVLITARGRDTLTADQAARLEKAGEITYYSALEPLMADELIERLRDADVAGLTPRSVPSIDGSWVNRLPRLKGIAVFATGVDYIDMRLLEERGITLCHLPDYSTYSVAEHTIGLLLTMSRRMHLSSDRVRGRVPAGTSVQGWELRGRTIGLVGLGRIGSYVAGLCQAFGMRVIGYDPYLEGNPPAGVRLVSLDELLVSSDIVSLHYPSDWHGGQRFGRDELHRMKPGAVLVNVSRSALVDDAAVIDAIERRQLRGYAVDDRFSLAERGERLIAEGRIVQTGHTAWYSEEVIERGYHTWVDNIISLLDGQPHHVASFSTYGSEIRRM